MLFAKAALGICKRRARHRIRALLQTQICQGRGRTEGVATQKKGYDQDLPGGELVFNRQMRRSLSVDHGVRSSSNASQLLLCPEIESSELVLLRAFEVLIRLTTEDAVREAAAPSELKAAISPFLARSPTSC